MSLRDERQEEKDEADIRDQKILKSLGFHMDGWGCYTERIIHLSPNTAYMDCVSKGHSVKALFTRIDPK